MSSLALAGLALGLSVVGLQASGDTLRELAKRRLLIGTAAEPWLFPEPGYSETRAAQFNLVEPENGMKFDQIHPRPDSDPEPYNFKGPDELVQFALAHHMKVRGHTLVWHNQQPKWVTQGKMTPDQLGHVLRSHIQTVMHRYSGKVFAWDVVNEAFNDNGTLRSTVWFNRPGIGMSDKGTGYIEQAFRWARQSDRRAKLCYNDYGAETINSKSDAIYTMLQDFKKRRVPIDGIGFQMHCDLNFVRPEVLKSFSSNMKRFADLGLEIHITELDLRLRGNSSTDFEAQAKGYREIMDACLAEPKCRVVQFWGFTDKHSWIPRQFKGEGWALLWDDTYQAKPSLHAIQDALKQQGR